MCTDMQLHLQRMTWYSFTTHAAIKIKATKVTIDQSTQIETKFDGQTKLHSQQ